MVSSELLPSGMLSPGDLLLRPHARGLSHGGGLGRLAAGGRALGDQDLPERVCGVPAASHVQEEPSVRPGGVGREPEAVDICEGHLPSCQAQGRDGAS